MTRRPLVSLLATVLLMSACSTSAEPDVEGSDDALSATATCVAQPACDDTSEPPLGETTPWSNPLSPVFAIKPFDHHRGRDLVVVEGEAQWIIGKFAYGLFDKDLKGELVDVFVERDCGGHWEKLGTARTTEDDEHATVEGVEDSGGRIYFQIPKDKQLPLGRHRVRLVVEGDHTQTDMLVDVVTQQTPMFVSDVDGTLTSSENIEFQDMLRDRQPDAQPDAATVLGRLAARGYHPIYLTARPEWLTHQTRRFLAERGFPPGIIHTTTSVTGAIGRGAAAFKAQELQALASKGIDVRWAFGNQPTDADAYQAASFKDLVRRIFLRIATPVGRDINGYAELLPDVSSDPVNCESRGSP